MHVITYSVPTIGKTNFGAVICTKENLCQLVCTHLIKRKAIGVIYLASEQSFYFKLVYICM